MNKYIIPVVDMEVGDDHLEIIHANSLEECKSKVMNNLLYRYEFLDETSTYPEFVKRAFNESIYICSIVDIEEL